MESENETHPLLHDFENETWRSKARKRCLRIPSEVAITGIILGLFFVVVTLLIVLENIEDTKDKDLTVDKNLLASPFKYNKKAEDKTWQDKKDNMKAKKKQNDLKWDNANKGWKKFPDISGKIDNKWNQAPTKNLQDNVNNLELPAIVDEYGKDVEDSWEQLISKEEIDPSFFKTSYEDVTDLASLSQSPKLHWDGIDDDWKRLSLQGWTDKEIRDALFQALKERKEEIKETEGLLQSPMNFNQLRDKINDNWKKKMQGGNTEMDYQKMKGKKEVENQKSINDEWKNKITLLQSPKATMKNIVKADDGWKKLSEQGWKIDDLKKAMFEAWKEKDPLQPPANLQNAWGKSSDFLKNLVQKGLDKQKSQKDMNDEWANKFGGLLQSPKSSTKKGSTIEEIMKIREKYDQKDKNTNKSGQQGENIPSINFEDFLENIVETIKEYQKENKTKNSDKAGMNKNNLKYSSMKVEDFMKNVIDAIKEHQKGNKEAKNQKSINNEWKKSMNVLYTAKNPDQKVKKIDDHWKTLIEYERNSYLEKGDGSAATSSKDAVLQYSMSQDNIKLENEDSGWKRLTEQGWKDQDLKEAVYKAWKEGEKLLQSATGYNNMKWKKVNDGWKKISNKS